MKAPVLQRKCSCGGRAKAGGDCEECRKKRSSLQRKAAGTAPSGPSLAPPIVHDVLRSPGRPLDAGTRASIEPRFGHDFSQVRIHADARAAESARAVDARAYTVGRHVVFGETLSRGLLAHELAHVVQQGVGSRSGAEIEVGDAHDPAEAQADAWAAHALAGHAPASLPPTVATGVLRRSVASSSSCTASTDGAPADPIASLTALDEKARLAAFVGHHLLFIEAMTRNHPTFGPSSVSTAFLNWFGPPEETTPGTWKSRFGSETFTSEGEAIAHEMDVVSGRFETLEKWFSGSIKYLCPGTSAFTIPGCGRAKCTRPAHACPGSRTIAVCPDFWTSPVPEAAKATLLVHEALHAAFKFRTHPTATPKERGRNPYCYQGFLNEELATGAQVDKSLCNTSP